MYERKEERKNMKTKFLNKEITVKYVLNQIQRGMGYLPLGGDHPLKEIVAFYFYVLPITVFGGDIGIVVGLCGAMVLGTIFLRMSYVRAEKQDHIDFLRAARTVKKPNSRKK